MRKLRRKWKFVIAALVAGAALGIILFRVVSGTVVNVAGAVVTRDADPRKQLPINNVNVSVAGGRAISPVRTDASGLFTVSLRPGSQHGERVVLRFRHPQYQPFDWPVAADGRLYIARLLPINQQAEATRPKQPEVTVSNVSARYSINSTSVVNVGSAVKAFEVVNKGNVPCDGHYPCSPDGQWKAALGSEVLDAGAGNEFHNARASCIAGPCAFTKIESGDFSRNTRTFRVSALSWSDTATFLMEAEVFHPQASSVLRQSYPVIFGRTLNFTLPGAAEGVSIEAELNGSMIVFPLGPALLLSWANCQVTVTKEQTRVYRCELKPGYRFP